MTEQKQNPYAKEDTKPKSEVLSDALAALKKFSIKGRIGRLRYICYSLGSILTALVIAFLLVSISTVGETLAIIILFAAFIAVCVLSILRFNDFNMPMWLSILIVIIFPVAIFVLFFIPGNDSENNFGKVPSENPTAITVMAILLLLLFGLAIASLSVFILVGSV